MDVVACPWHKETVDQVAEVAAEVQHCSGQLTAIPATIATVSERVAGIGARVCGVEAGIVELRHETTTRFGEIHESLERMEAKNDKWFDESRTWRRNGGEAARQAIEGEPQKHLKIPLTAMHLTGIIVIALLLMSGLISLGAMIGKDEARRAAAAAISAIPHAASAPTPGAHP